MDGPGMDPGWSRDGPWIDPGWPLDGPGINLGWTWDRHNTFISYSIILIGTSGSLSLELQAYFL